MKVIFLDVDGELTYSDYNNKETANIDIDKVRLLKEICDHTGAKVVISSSWRGGENYTPKIYYTLRRILAENKIDVLGDTPYIDVKLVNYDKSKAYPADTKFDIEYGTGRAAEIQAWINSHDVDAFVILDDDDFSWADYGYERNWVRPTWFGDGGLKREHVEQAIHILNNL